MQVCGTGDGGGYGTAIRTVYRGGRMGLKLEENEIAFENTEFEMPRCLLHPIGRWVCGLELSSDQSLAQMEIDAWEK